jgi:hypothetical protein
LEVKRIVGSKKVRVGSGPIAFVVCLISRRVVVFGRAEQLSAENVFHAQPQKSANVSIQNDEIHENEDAAQRVEQLGEFPKVPQFSV